MKTGLTIQQMAQELLRQSKAKQDYLVNTGSLSLSVTSDVPQLRVTENGLDKITPLDIRQTAHRQLGTYLGIPQKYYELMRTDAPELLAYNANYWFSQKNELRTLRTIDGCARAFLSNRYRRIDNLDIASVTLPVIGELPEARFVSTQITDDFMYIKVVNPRLQADVMETMARHIIGKPNGRGGKWTVYGLHSRAFIEFGCDTPASPDGRRKGDHLSKNVAPSVGAETEGVTGTLRSYAKIRPENFPCGSVLDIMISPATVSGKKGLAAFRALVQYWMDNGGTALNVNIVSAEELRDAQAHPEKYENLQVRVAGWNVRWNDIPKREQDDFIWRAEEIAR